MMNKTPSQTQFPLVLVPLVGAEPVVPIIAISAIFTNSSRALAYLRHVDRRRALVVLACAALTTALGAYGYTRLTNAGAALVIGTMLILSVPLRRVLRRRHFKIGDAGLATGAVGYGVLVGGTSGSGVILLSLLMAAGLEGAAVIATDATISLGTGLIKISVFGLAGAVTAQVAAAMAEGAQRLYDADLAVSTTGVAGPGPDARGVPEGTVHLGIARRGGPARTREVRLCGGRAEIRALAVQAALDELAVELADPSES